MTFLHKNINKKCQRSNRNWKRVWVRKFELEIVTKVHFWSKNISNKHFWKDCFMLKLWWMDKGYMTATT